MNSNENLKKESSVFFIDLNKIEVNPYQPRIEFDEEKLKALAESIKQYGILQPIVVSRKEEYSDEFGIRTKYQIIAGERRFRAAKIAGLKQIPAIIREKEDTDAEKLELAIIENLQREDLNPVDKAKAFKRLADEFGLKHVEIAKKMGKSREYVSNAMRILMLPENILNGLVAGKITEGHTRSLLMLKDRPEEQQELYKRIVEDKLTVRAAEKIARNVAIDKIRKKVDLDPEIKDIENHIREKLGTKVSIDQRPLGDGGKLTIEFFSKDDLRKILAMIESDKTVVEKNNDGVTDTFAEGFHDKSQNLEEEINSYEDIQPTIFKEEIEKIEQFGNVLPDENNIRAGQGVKDLEGDNSKLDPIRKESGTVAFQGFSIAPEINSQSGNKEYSFDNGLEKDSKDSFDLVIDNNRDGDFSNDEVVVNNFDIDNIGSNGKIEIGNKDLSSNENISQEIKNELSKLDNSSVNNNQKDINNPNLKQGIVDKKDSQKNRIKNDFDRSRIDSFAKTEDILKSFTLGSKIIDSEVGKLKNGDNFVLDNNYEQEGNNSAPLDDQIGGEDKLAMNDSSDIKKGYSDLYTEFLKSKKKLMEEKGTQQVVSRGSNSLDNSINLVAADNFVVEKKPEDLSSNMTNLSQVQDDTKDIFPEAEVKIITNDTDEFLAAAKEHKAKNDDIIVDDKKKDEGVDGKDDSDNKGGFSFKGFSL